MLAARITSAHFSGHRPRCGGFRDRNWRQQGSRSGTAREGASDQLRAIARENTTSTSVPLLAALLRLNCARLASTSALVSDRLTPDASDDWSEGGGVRKGSRAAATSLSLS